ncbi:MAG: hypothetical protein LBC75_00055 [Fibromonadaceae bacterium]|nr:hypothetical protein [Fibromonadaceae bacterium]
MIYGIYISLALIAFTVWSLRLYDKHGILYRSLTIIILIYSLSTCSAVYYLCCEYENYGKTHEAILKRQHAEIEELLHHQIN